MVLQVCVYPVATTSLPNFHLHQTIWISTWVPYKGLSISTLMLCICLCKVRSFLSSGSLLQNYFLKHSVPSLHISCSTNPPTTNHVNFLLSIHTTSNSLLTQITPSHWESVWVTTFEYHAPRVKLGTSNHSSIGWMRKLSLWEKHPPMLFGIHMYLAGMGHSSA